LLLIEFTNPNILYVAARGINGCLFTDINLLKSTNSGVTWGQHAKDDYTGCLADALLATAPTDL